jgi:multiple sugar transport system ATP-binding protein
MNMGIVKFDGVGKTYPDGTRAVTGLTLEIAEGEFLVFVGPSGCGKTTALRMVAGLEEISEGTLSIGGRVVNNVAPQGRDIAMVFQNYALYPHMTVFDNIAFPLASRRMPKAQIAESVNRVARLLDLAPFLKQRPKNLSGGQRQRVAMGRALVRDPAVFLMDEPLSNLDAKLRVQMRAEISRIQRELAVTTVYVTHDQVEAMTMGDRIAVMRHGVLQQIGSPQELYDNPKNLFVATFVGSPAMNLMLGEVVGDAGHAAVRIGTQEIALRNGSAPKGLSGYMGRRVAVGIRPEALGEATGTSGEAVLSGIVARVEPLGSDRLVHIQLEAAGVITAETLENTTDTAPNSGIDTGAVPDHHSVTVIARFAPSSTASVGSAQGMAVPADAFHFFDVDTGDRI